VNSEPTAEERRTVEHALAASPAERGPLLHSFTTRDGMALAAMLREAAIAYTDVVARIGPSADVLAAGQPLRLRYDTLQWMFDTLVQASVDRDQRATGKPTDDPHPVHDPS
jgi:hypothetical protein